METTHAQAPASDDRASMRLTFGVLAVVVAVALVFTFHATDASSHWFAIFKLIHVSVAVLWVGGGLLLMALALRAERAKDPLELATVARQAAFAGEKIFAPAGLVVLAMGIAMVINQHIGFGTPWVDVGLAGYAVTFLTGVAVLSPRAKRIAVLIDEQGAEHPETQAAISQILMIARFDVGLLLLVVADMLMKPFS